MSMRMRMSIKKKSNFKYIHNLQMPV